MWPSVADVHPLALAGAEWAVWWITILAVVGGLVAVTMAAARASKQIATSDALPWRVLGRNVRLVTLAVLLATSTITWALLSARPNDGSAAQVPYPWPAALLAAVALVGIAAMLGGWVTRSETAMQVGLACASATWAARAVYLALDNGWWSQTSILSWCWALVAAGTHLVSVVESRAGRRDV